MQIWMIQILGIIVHFMLMISVYDIRRGTESFQGYWTNCTNQPISKRLVLIVYDGLDAGLINYNLNHTRFLERIKKTGVWGRAVASNLMKRSAITPITSGLEEPQELFSNIYKKEHKEHDHVFNYATKTYYFGDEELLKAQFSIASQDWAKHIFQTKYNTTQRNDTITEVFTQIFDNDIKNKQSLNKLIIFVHLPQKMVTPNEKSFKAEGKLVVLNKIIKNVTLTVENSFKDKQTVFILCSDKVEINKKTNRSESLFLMWGNNVNQRGNVTINMTDISLIVSTVLGNPSPLSSVSNWKDGLMNMSSLEEAKAKACNALHLATVASAVLQQVGNKVLKTIGLSHSSDEEAIKEFEKQLSILLTNSNNSREISDQSDVLSNISTNVIKKDIVFIQEIINSLMHLTYIGWSLFLLTKIVSLSISRDAALKHEIMILRRKTELWFFGLHTVLILLGGLCILFVVIQSWPIYYVMYCLPVLIIWGSVVNNIQNWIGFLNKLHKRKIAFILLYGLVYGLMVEAYFWGLSYKFLLGLIIACIASINVGTSYINNEYIGIKIATILSGLLIIAVFFVPLDNKTEAIPVVISSGLVWPVTGILSTFYMWISNEIIDSVVMIACLTHYCTSLIIILISTFQGQPMSPVIFMILFATGYYIPIFGKAFIPAAEIPLNIDRYRKSNRLQHVCFCTSSLILLFSVSFETLFAFILYGFSILWVLITEPKIQIESLNRNNAHFALTFTMLVIIVQHVMGLNEPAQEILYAMKHFMPAGDLIAQVLEKVRIYLPVFIIQFLFTSLTLSSGGESQLLLAMLIQNLCGYRLFLGMEGIYKHEHLDIKILAHTSLQALIMFQFMTRQLVQCLLHASVLKLCDCIRSIIEGIRNITNR